MKNLINTLIVSLLIASITFNNAIGQSVGIGTETPNSSAMLDVTSAEKGMLIPRMNQSQMEAINNPALGLLVYQTNNSPGFRFFDGLNWVQMVGELSQVEKITEGNNTGYAILDRVAANYGDIGQYAVDLSTNNYPGTTRGATGIYSFATGEGTTASGGRSAAFNRSLASGSFSFATGDGTSANGDNSLTSGRYTQTNGENSVALGQSTFANGESSLSAGISNLAQSFGETVLGTYATTPGITNSATSYNVYDRALTVGVGSGPTDRKDGLVVFKNGTTFISNEGNTLQNGLLSILNGIGGGALQVRSSGAGIGILTPAAPTSFNIQKTTQPFAGNTYATFSYDNGTSGSIIGSLTTSSSRNGINYNTTSDQRLKEDHGMYENALNEIDKILIHNYTWKNGGQKSVGVFAQELYPIFPEAVSKGDDDIDSVSGQVENPWAVDYSKLVPFLVAAIQELNEKNKVLESKIEKLIN